MAQRALVRNVVTGIYTETLIPVLSATHPVAHFIEIGHAGDEARIRVLPVDQHLIARW